MRNVYIRTKDERLKRELTLLLPQDHHLSEEAENALIIADADTESTEGADLIISYETNAKGKARLTRPFTTEEFLSSLARLEKQTHERLTPTEEKLFSLLKQAGGAPVSRELLLKEVWGEGGTEGLLNLYIHYLREKLEKDGQRRIFSARGKGYFYKC